MIVNEFSGSSPFEFLELLSNEVFLPILSSPENQAEWGEVPTREIYDRFNSFLSSTTVLCGQVKGETRLPMPPLDFHAPNESLKNKISLLEGAVVMWTKQIRNILALDPESLLKQGHHATPEAEIKFWKEKATNLNSVYEQLQGTKIRKVLDILDQAKSTYSTPFTRLCAEVVSARVEANDNTKYLSTIEDWVHKLNGEEDFPSLVNLFKPLLHITLLIWKNSKFYNTPSRLVVLVREVCNSVISQATKYVSGEQLFAMVEAEEAHIAANMLKMTLHVCSALKSTYAEYKALASTECPSNPWKIQSNAIFIRLDTFVERCHDLLEMMHTIVRFTKLSKIEVGGTKGKVLSATIRQVYDDFSRLVDGLKQVPYDLMNVDNSQFDIDYQAFRGSIKELEKRIGAIICLAFDDCATVYGRFKILDSFEVLLERPVIQDTLEKKYIFLVQSFGQELKSVQDLFLQSRDNPPIASNLPPISGTLSWCRSLLERVQAPMAKLQQLNRSVLDREETKEIIKIYNSITASFTEYENQKVEEWASEVEQFSAGKLNQFLLLRDIDTRMLSVNFDTAIVRLLREVKYFLLLGLEVPETALEIYKQVEVYRTWTIKLDLIVNMNNEMLEILLPVEKPLVAPFLAQFDNAVEIGIAQLTWKSTGVNEFLAESLLQVKGASEIVRALKANLSGIHTALTQFNKPLLSRKSKPMLKEEFDREFKAVLKTRYSEIKEGGKAIHSIVKECNKILRVSNSSTDWKAYIDFINSIVVDGLARMVTTSMEYLLDQLDVDTLMKDEKQPMLEIKLDLVHPRNSTGSQQDLSSPLQEEICFIPDLYESGGRGLRDMTSQWIGSFFNATSQFKRLDNEGSYVREIHANENVMLMLAELNETFEKYEQSCMQVKASYDVYSFLWSTDLDTHLATFKAEAEYVTSSGQTLLDLTKFSAAISKYEDFSNQVDVLPSPVDCGWLRINTAPAKAQLSNWVTKWVDKFSNTLKAHVVEKLTTLDTFIQRVQARLIDIVAPAPVTAEVSGEGHASESSATPTATAGANATNGETGDNNSSDVTSAATSESHHQHQTENLMATMETIRDVRKAMDTTAEIFPPMQQAIDLLKQHGKDINSLGRIGDRLLQDYLDDAPMTWQAIVKKTLAKKEEIQPQQQDEIKGLKIKLEEFFISVREFRNNFRSNAPFAFTGSISEAYILLDIHAHELQLKEVEAKRCNELEELFELSLSKYLEISDTKAEIKLLKSVWDMRSLIVKTFESWSPLAWNDIKTDDLEDIGKQLLKSLRKMATDNPVMKGWPAYRSIEDMIKTMSVVLPLINALHSTAMRDRHWKSLAKLCKVKSVDPNDPKFTFEDAVKLNLHEHVDEVEEVVELATKELKIEKKLKDIETAWRDMPMEYSPHNDSEMKLIKPSEELVEGLESHQLELQTMVGMGKFVEFFKDRVLVWQNKLGHTEDVIKIWVSVSRNWMSLESIFLASADIRSQLPEDTKRFEGLDSEFKELMKDAVNEPNVINVTSVEGRLVSDSEHNIS